MNFIDKVKKVLGSPHQFFNSVRKETYGPVLQYYIIISIIGSILTGLVTAYSLASALPSLAVINPEFAAIVPMLSSLLTPTMIGVGIVLLIIASIVGLFIGGIVFHIGLYIVGARQGYRNTIKSLGYGSTAQYLLGWIPYIGPIFGLWSLYLNIKGASVLHKISMWRALGGLIIGIVIAIAIMLAIMGTLIAIILTIFGTFAGVGLPPGAI